MGKRPTDIEIDEIENLSMEALDWLDDECPHLVWIQKRWRIWDSPAEDHELTPYDIVERRHHTLRNIPWKPPIIKRSVDVIRFESNKDAVYFKMRFM